MCEEISASSGSDDGTDYSTSRHGTVKRHAELPARLGTGCHSTGIRRRSSRYCHLYELDGAPSSPFCQICGVRLLTRFLLLILPVFRLGGVDI